MINTELVSVSIALIVKEADPGHFSVWLQRRDDPLDSELDASWEAPGGKWEEGESALEACRREVLEETGTTLESLYFFKDYSWKYERRQVILHAFLAHESTMPLNDDQKWFTLSFDKPLETLKDKIPAANHQIMEDLALAIKRAKAEGDWSQLWA